MVQIVICRSLFTLNVILNLVLYAVNINDIHVCVCFFFLEVQLPKAGFSKSCIYYYYYYYYYYYLFIYLLLFFFIRQSVIVFQEIGKNPKKRNGEREKEEDRYIS